jgi:hypothetical protein
METGTGMAEYLELGDIARELRNSLAFRMIAPAADLPAGTQQAFSQAIMHLGLVREGFAVSLRASDTPNLTEMRKLVQAILFDWDGAAQMLGVELTPDEKIEMPAQQMLAYAHSYVTMGVLPSLPADAITYPQMRRSYADIHAPRTAGEVLERIEEMEAVVSEAELNPIERIEGSRLRRTYGFFEASAWLVAWHAARFQRKKP